MDIEALHPTIIGRVQYDRHYIRRVAVSVYDILRHLTKDRKRITWREENVLVQAWANYWDAHYYGRPAESFSLDEAFEEAARKGAAVVIVENLS